MRCASTKSFVSRLLASGLLWLILLVVSSCSSAAPQPQAGAPGDLAFPTPVPVAGSGAQPPAAWLVVGEEAIPATYGSFCYGGMCVDMVPPHMMPDLATASLPADEQATIVVGSPGIAEFSASVQSWTAQGGGEAQELPAEGEVKDDKTFFTLQPLPDGDDQLLQVFVTFQEGGDASYLWRLNPAQ